jgi:hypothetical protein
VKWIGLDVASKQVVVVQLFVPEEGPLVVEYDQTWPLQKGARPAAYRVMFDRLANHIRDRKIDAVAIIGSSGSKFAASLGLLESAELRGVVAAAAASVVGSVKLRAKLSLSRASSRGKVDLYTEDDTYWAAALKGKLRKGSREAAYVVIAEARGSAEAE